MTKLHTINTLEELNTIYGEPNQTSLDKETTFLTPAYKQWIETAPFFALASIGAGGLDCSPRGDKKGELLKIQDDKTLLIPDRRGNNRLDTLKNIISNPQIALLFLIPGINETLRVNGQAQISTDPDLLKGFSIEGKEPATVLIIKIDSVYFQCARALIRSRLWDPVHFEEKTNVPTAGQMTRSAFPEFDADTYDSALPTRQKSSLY